MLDVVPHFRGCLNEPDRAHDEGHKLATQNHGQVDEVTLPMWGREKPKKKPIYVLEKREVYRNRGIHTVHEMSLCYAEK